MEKLKSIDYEILFELLKNSRRSDRELAKAVGSSQPTITRKRSALEKNIIKGYTAIPDFAKVGFELLAFNFIKLKKRFAKAEEWNAKVNKTREWFMKQPNVIFASAGEGMGWDGIAISLHNSYSEFVEFKRKNFAEYSEIIAESQSFIVDINPGIIIKPFHFKYLAKAK